MLCAASPGDWQTGPEPRRTSSLPRRGCFRGSTAGEKLKQTGSDPSHEFVGWAGLHKNTSEWKGRWVSFRLLHRELTIPITIDNILGECGALGGECERVVWSTCVAQAPFQNPSSQSAHNCVFT